MTDNKSKPYILPGNPVIDLPVERVGQLLYDERGEVVQAKLNEAFKGNNQITDTHEYKQGEPISFSNIPRALKRAQILREENNGEIRLLDPIQMVQHWVKLKGKQGTYSDSSAVSIYPEEGPNELLRKIALEIIGKDPAKLEIPLLVMGLDVRPADNAYGFTLIETPFTRPIEAPFLQKDQRVKYDPKTNTLVPTDDDSGVQILTPDDQSGLRRAYRGRSVGLYFWNDSVLDADSSGRVDVVQDPKGRAEDLTLFIDLLERETKAQPPSRIPILVQVKKGLEEAVKIK